MSARDPEDQALNLTHDGRRSTEVLTLFQESEAEKKEKKKSKGDSKKKKKKKESR